MRTAGDDQHVAEAIVGHAQKSLKIASAFQHVVQGGPLWRSDQAGRDRPTPALERDLVEAVRQVEDHVAEVPAATRISAARTWSLVIDCPSLAGVAAAKMRNELLWRSR